MKDTHEEIMSNLQRKFGEDWTTIYKLAISQALSIHDYANVFGLDGTKVLALVSTIVKLIKLNHEQKTQAEIEEFLNQVEKEDLEENE